MLYMHYSLGLIRGIYPEALGVEKKYMWNILTKER